MNKDIRLVEAVEIVRSALTLEHCQSYNHKDFFAGVAAEVSGGTSVPDFIEDDAVRTRQKNMVKYLRGLL
jgi:hypothetical protein